MKQLLIISFFTLFISCKENKISTSHTVSPMTNDLMTNDVDLHLLNGTWFYHDKPVTGTIKELFTDGSVKSVQRLENGRQQGYSEIFYPGGKAESRRWYTKGEKDSVHTGWWENGNKKYEYHFSNGNYNGLFTEWYQSGKMIQQVVYDYGKEVSGQGWRENGKLYMSFVMKNGRRYGLFNANLCYSLVKENIK